MIRYGFEREYFVADAEGKYVLCPPALPKDECGYLAECRGTAHEDIVVAGMLFKRAEAKLYKEAEKLGVKLVLTPSTVMLDKLLKREALRAFGKNPYEPTRFNMYGKDYKLTDKWDRAGLHVHFSNSQEIGTDKCATCNQYKSKQIVKGPLNIPEIIKYFDVKYKQEIAKAHRLPGWYELKVHGFEYRSLPADVDIMELAGAFFEAKVKVEG